VDGFDVPEELIALRRAFEQADERCRRISDQVPSGQDIIAGTAHIDAGLSYRLAQARAERLRIVVEIDNEVTAACFRELKSLPYAPFAGEDRRRTALGPAPLPDVVRPSRSRSAVTRGRRHAGRT
jgi:hypothetical protein